MIRALTEQEYVEKNPHFFRRLHVHDGIWWDQIYPGYARPAFKFQAVAPMSARPSRLKSFLGYGHCVPDIRMANHTLDYMVLEGDLLRGFGLDRLDSKKRNQVRKGLKCCEVKELDQLEPYLEDAREICISHSIRGLSSRESYHVSTNFFVDQVDTWYAQMRRDFMNNGRRWFGAWYEDRLIAYLVTLQVGHNLIIEKHKLHTDYLKFCPSDALYFRVLEQAAKDESCQRIFNSTPQRAGLDRFKEQFLFKATPIPFYLSNPVAYRLAMRAMKIRKQMLATLAIRREKKRERQENRTADERNIP